jgi:hypothetical protein
MRTSIFSEGYAVTDWSAARQDDGSAGLKFAGIVFFVADKASRTAPEVAATFDYPMHIRND